jgi:Mg-chelatase subunit ChlI
MKVLPFEDDALETIIRGNVDAFFSDLAAGAGQTELAKSSRDVREAEELDHFSRNLMKKCRSPRSEEPAVRRACAQNVRNPSKSGMSGTQTSTKA